MSTNRRQLEQFDAMVPSKLTEREHRYLGVFDDLFDRFKNTTDNSELLDSIDQQRSDLFKAQCMGAVIQTEYDTKMDQLSAERKKLVSKELNAIDQQLGDLFKALCMPVITKAEYDTKIGELTAQRKNIVSKEELFLASTEKLAFAFRWHRERMIVIPFFRRNILWFINRRHKREQDMIKKVFNKLCDC